jgi:hypothetical protein
MKNRTASKPGIATLIIVAIITAALVVALAAYGNQKQLNDTHQRVEQILAE